MIYDISFTPPLEMFQHILEGQRPNGEWTLSILDTNDIVFGRVPNPEDSFGKHVSSSIYAAMQEKSEAVLPTVSLEGVPLIAGFVQSKLTGWIVAAGITEPSLVAPLWRKPCDCQRNRRCRARNRPRLRGQDGHGDRARRDAA